MARAVTKLVVTLAVLVGAGETASAQTAEIDADFSKYCREAFANSAYQRRAQAWGVEHYCMQGGTLQGINLAEACRTTTGNAEFRIDGARVLCAEGSAEDQTGGQPLSTEEMVRYCRERFPNSIYQHVPGNFGAEHVCRQTGGLVGFTLQPIDLADACTLATDSAGYRVAGSTVMCEAGVGDDGAGAPPQVASRPADDGDGADDPPDAERGDGFAEEPDAGTPPADETADATQEGEQPDATKGVGVPLDGVWRMTEGGIRKDLLVRLETDGDSVTGFIEEYPEPLAEVARMMDGLAPGDVFFVGRVEGDRLTGRTRIGIGGASQAFYDIIGSASAVRCGDLAARLEGDRENWMRLEAEIDGTAIRGRHEMVHIFVAPTTGGECRATPAETFPPRIEDGWAVLEMEAVRESECELSFVAESGKQRTRQTKQRFDPADLPQIPTGEETSIYRAGDIYTLVIEEGDDVVEILYKFYRAKCLENEHDTTFAILIPGFNDTESRLIFEFDAHFFPIRLPERLLSLISGYDSSTMDESDFRQSFIRELDDMITRCRQNARNCITNIDRYMSNFDIEEARMEIRKSIIITQRIRMMQNIADEMTNGANQ